MKLLDWLASLLGGRHGRGGVSPFPPGSGPARLLVMRHAEKTGDPNDPHLSSQGIERAKRVADYIPKTFGKIDVIFAARDSKKSIRPRETVEPLAAALGLRIDGRFDDEEPETIIKELSQGAYRGKTALLSWRHSDLAGFIRMLGAPEGTFPDPWPSSGFDTIMEIVYAADGTVSARAVQPPF